MAEFVESKGGKPKVDAFFEEVRALQVTKVFDHKVRLYAVLEALFGSSMDAASVKDKSKLVDKFIKNANLKCREVLWVFGAYIEANKSWEAAKRFPPVLKQLDDEADGKPGFDKAKAAAKP